MPSPSAQIGAATVTVLTVGTLRIDLGGWLRVPEALWEPEHQTLFTQPMLVPMQCVLIASPASSVLVDACHPEAIGASTYAPPGYQPPPGLLDQLAALGVAPEAIDHVVITHAHFDHYSGIVAERDGADAPCFPHARHYLGRADWDDALEELSDAASLEVRALGTVQRAGLLELVDARRELPGDVSIIPAPGETAGHLIVRVASQGQALYCLGDMYHDPVEFAHPDWTVYWADRAASLRGREALHAAALAENALLVATHIPGFGRLRPAGDGVRWVGQ
jgi:glyoxylase-like metal-dependent hydrolase (beta-lactamase superfamily II)